MEEIKTAFSDLIVNIIVTLLIPIIFGLIAAYLEKLREVAAQKINTLKYNTEKELLKNTINNLDNLITQSVIALQVTLVKELKNANADGKLTKEDAWRISNELTKIVKGQLTDEVKETLKTQINDIDAYIANKAEVVLALIKGEIDRNVIRTK